MEHNSVDLLLKYFPGLTAGQQERFAAFDALYRTWNARINVISRKDIDNLYERHVLHSLAIAKFFGELAPGTEILDMGTGGGFPGIPLAVIYPHVKFHLIDRIGKKIRVCDGVTAALNLDNVTTQHGDIGECRRRFDYVVSRAVMRLDALVPLVRRNISGDNRNTCHNGLVCLKGLDIADESRAVNHPVIDYALSEFFSEEFFASKSLIHVPL